MAGEGNYDGNVDCSGGVVTGARRVLECLSEQQVGRKPERKMSPGRLQSWSARSSEFQINMHNFLEKLCLVQDSSHAIFGTDFY